MAGRDCTSVVFKTGQWKEVTGARNGKPVIHRCGDAIGGERLSIEV